MLACSIDGELRAPAQASIPVDDHGLLYGDGIFEGLRFYNGRVFRLGAHLARLEDSARALRLALPVIPGGFARTIDDTIAASGLGDGYIRLLVTRGSGSMGLDPTSCSRPRVIVIVDELVMVDPAKRRDGISAIVSSVRRLSADQLDPRIKSLNYLNQIMARMEALAAGADEAIILNDAGRVAEGTADNVFIVKQGRLTTPPVTEGALDGITRATIIELANTHDVPLREQPLGVWDLFTADECFLTGTGAELIPVASIAGRAIGGRDRPVFERLSEAFTALVDLETKSGAPETLC
jgi:branched-chain amino acid aminotransferase